MEDDVSAKVLKDNYRQNVVLGNARAGAPALITVHQRMIRELERQELLNRALEFLPDDEEIDARRLAGEGLTSPELAVLLAYAKISLNAELNASDIGEDEWFQTMLPRYFPPICVERYPEEIRAHPLRSDIITTVATNELINIGGITFFFRAVEEYGAGVSEIVRAAMSTLEIFQILPIRRRINALDNLVPTATQTALHLETRRLLDRATRWFLQTRGGVIDVGLQIATFRPIVEKYASAIPRAMLGQEADRLRMTTDHFITGGAPPDLAETVACMLDTFTLLDITTICANTGESPDTVIPLYFMLSERYDVDKTLRLITGLPRGDRWNALARQALRTDLYGVLGALTENVIRTTPADESTVDRVVSWERSHEAGLARARATLDEISAQEEADLATLSVALRVMRNLVAQGSASPSD
jgi:glutamate dehydrogenase